MGKAFLRCLPATPKNVYMVPRPGRSERTPVKRTVVPLAMLNLVASAAANVPHWHSAKDWLDCGGTSIDISVSALLPTPHGRPPDPQGMIRPIGVECTPRNGPNPMVCWQLNGTAGIVNWTRATTYALDNGDTNATDVACVFDCAEKSDIVRNLLDSSAPAILAAAKPAIAGLAATDDSFIAASEFSGTTKDGQFTTRLTASSRRVDRAVDHFVPVPASNTATIAANHAIAQLPATEGKLDFWPTREDVPEDWGIPEPFECTECVEIHPYHFSCKNCSSNRPFCARREFLTGLCDQPVFSSTARFSPSARFSAWIIDTARAFDTWTATTVLSVFIPLLIIVASLLCGLHSGLTTGCNMAAQITMELTMPFFLAL